MAEMEGGKGGRRAGSSPLVSVIFPSSKSQASAMCNVIRHMAADCSHINLYDKNNMQSVKLRLEKIEFMIDNYLEYIWKKQLLLTDSIISKDCLIYNIFYMIICVPQLTTSDSYCYMNIYNTKTLTDTKNLGAFPRFWNLQSQNLNNIENKCDFKKIIIKRILKNQIKGNEPHVSIPETNNAITVQGIKIGDPHSHSFNVTLIYNEAGVRVCAPFILYKSDYVFILSNSTLYRESDTVSTCNLKDNLALRDENKRVQDNKIRKGNVSSTSASDNNVISPTINHRHNHAATSDTPISPTFRNGDYTFAYLLKLAEDAPKVIKQLRAAGETFNNWSIPRLMRLAGGGESSLNTPTGWGSPPSSNSNGNNQNWGNNASGGPSNNPQQQWVTNNQRPPVSQPDANSNKMNNSSGNNNSNIPPSTSSGNNTANSSWGGTAPSQQQQPQGGSNNGGGSPSGGTSGGANGAGGTSTPGSIAPSTPPQAATSAKTQLEQLNTMRESLFSLDGWGGQHVNQDTNWDVPNSPEPGVKMDQAGGGPPMWKPNINNGTDLWEANLRNGGQPPPQPVAKTPWGHTPTSNIGGTWGEDDDPPESNNVWNGPPPPQQWGGPPQQPPHWNSAAKKDEWGWNEPCRPDMHRPDMLRAPAPDHRDMRTLMGDMRGDPRGISGRLNGSTDMWGQHHMQHNMQPPNKIMGSNVGNGVNQWGAQAPKDMGLSKGSSGWEEPSPPAARRNMSNFDDGTSLWGQQRGGSVGMGPWKDMSGGMGRAMPCPPGMPPNRMPGMAPNPMKPDSMWGQHPHRNGSWEDPSGHTGGTNWEKDGSSSWNENPMGSTGGGWPGPKSKPISGPGGSWDSDMGDWCGGPKPPGGGPPAKLLPKDVVWNSKQFRLLADMGYKKEDVEQALRSRDMNVDEALDLLSQMRGGGGIDTWRRHDEHPAGPQFEHQQQYPAAPPRPHHSFPPQQPPSTTLQFAQPSINNMSPAMVQKMINPTNQPQPQFNPQNNQSGGGGQPSTAQLRMLVQQIQMAVSTGYLNHQILNQPLAPQTLLLLNQLLQQIKLLQKQLSQQTMMQNSMAVGKNNSAFLQHSYQITKTKQQIATLQSQITAQQNIYVQQQASGGNGNTGPSSTGPSTGDFLNRQHDPLAQLQNNFTDLALSKEPPGGYGSGSGQQSRLNQWKLPSIDKEVEGPEFSRAPGTTSKSATSPQLNPHVLQSDNTWSSGIRGQGVSDGWPTSDTSDLPDGKDAWPASQQHANATPSISDLIPEFEPGKPWKGNPMKNIEDDPAITPGSVALSPLSLAAIKEPNSVVGVGGKVSPNTPSLSSSTWTYPPPPSSTPSSLGIPKGDSLWGSKPSTAGGRPPTSKSSAAISGPNAWAAPAPPRNQQYNQQSWPSTWLLLKNLTTQIDGSTLKTLCLQHGPLQSFHLYLNQSIALAKYSTREEANKAQTALNNCVLGNTTIFAESPGDTDVKLILQHLGQGGGGGGQWRTGGGGGGSTPAGGASSNDWSYPSLWSENDQRATPSLSFLPQDLLGGESM